MNFFWVLLQGVLGTLCFIMPGIWLLSMISRQRMHQWPLAFTLAACFVLSTNIIAGLQLLTLTFFNPPISRFLIWFFIFLVLVYTIRRGGKIVLNLFTGLSAWERSSLFFLLLLTCFWLLTIPLSPYPSHLSLDLGDTPAYYRVASNLLEGKGWLADFFVGDYDGGQLSYVTRQPLLVLVTIFFFQVFGRNWYSLYVFCILGAGILIYLTATLICLRPDVTKVKDKLLLFVTILLSLIPTHFLLFGLGALTVPGALAFLTVLAFFIVRLVPSGLRNLILAASVIFLFWLRPEALLLAMLIIIILGVRKLWMLTRFSKTLRLTVIMSCLLIPSLLWLNLPRIISQLPLTSRGFSLFYLRFDSQAGDFVPMYKPWPELNRQLSRANFLHESILEKLRNGSIGEQLRDHPMAFLRYLIEQTPRVAFLLLRALSFPDRDPLNLAGFPAMVLMLAMLTFGFIDARNRPLSLIIIGYLIFMPILNIGVGVRHILTVSPAMLCLALRPIMREDLWKVKNSLTAMTLKRWFRPAMATLVTAMIMGNALWLVEVRMARANRSYVNILKDIEKLTAPEDVIASSYPQLITCVTGRKSIGATWLIHNIELIINKAGPDFILIDEARNTAKNYMLLGKWYDWKIPGYTPILYNAEDHYFLFRSDRYDKHD